MFLMFQEVCDFLMETSTDQIVQSLMFFFEQISSTHFLCKLSAKKMILKIWIQNKGRQRQITEVLPVIRDRIRSQYRG